MKLLRMISIRRCIVLLIFFNICHGIDVPRSSKSLLTAKAKSFTMQAGGIGGINVSSKTCSLNFPAQYTTITVQVNAKYGNYINCLEPGDSGSCTQIDNAEWGPYSEPVTVYLVDGGSINNPDVQLIWEELPIGPFCYPGQYPINKQVNNSVRLIKGSIHSTWTYNSPVVVELLYNSFTK